MLGMYIDQKTAEFFQQLVIDRSVVNKTTGFHVGKNFPAYHRTVRIIEFVSFEPFIQVVVCNPVNNLDHTFLSLIHNGRRFGPLSQGQPDRSQQNGFSGSGFPGDNRQSLLEFDFGFIDQCIIIYGDTFNHNINSFSPVSKPNISNY